MARLLRLERQYHYHAALALAILKFPSREGIAYQPAKCPALATQTVMAGTKAGHDGIVGRCVNHYTGWYHALYLGEIASS